MNTCDFSQRSTHLVLSWLVRLSLIFALIVTTITSALPLPRIAHAAPSPQPGTWPFWRYDMQRTNRVPPGVASGAITQPVIKWIYPIGGAPNAWVADITGLNGLPDGQPEVIVWGSGRLSTYRKDGSPLWISDLLPGFRELAFVGDVDSNGTVEILVYTLSPDKWQLLALAGNTGKTLSVITDSRIGTSLTSPRIADLNSDGKMEVFEYGGDGAGMSLLVYSYANGADSPQGITTISFGSGISDNTNIGAVHVSDVNSDSALEAIYIHQSARVSVLDASSLITTTRFFSLTSGYRRVYASTVTDVVPSLTGNEVFALWYFPGTVSIMALGQFGPAPTYLMTTTWLITMPVSFVDPIAEVVRLSASGSAHIVWSFFDTSTQQWETRVSDGLTGVVLDTASGHRRCRVLDVDLDPEKELILCQPQSGGLLVQVYDWNSSSDTLQPKWSQPRLVGDLVYDGDVPFSNPYSQSSDLNGDGSNDVLAMTPSRDALVAYSGVDGSLIGRYNFPLGYSCLVRYVGSVLDANTQVVLACGNGFIYMLDRTLTPQWQVYSGRGQARVYVVDTNGDSKNEIVLTDGQGNLQNLDPYTATLLSTPRTNWVLTMTAGRAMPNFWHPLNLDNGGLWEYPLLDAVNAPSYTLRIVEKSPTTAAESVLASYSFTGTPTSLPALLGVAQLNGSGLEDLLIAETTENVNRSLHAIQLSGGNLLPIWIGAIGAARVVASSPAFYDANGDGIDDFAINGQFPPRIYNGLNGLVLSASPPGIDGAIATRAQPMVAQLDSDSTQEVIFAATGSGLFTVFEHASPTLSLVYSRVITNATNAVAAVADISLSEPGLEILYAVGGVLGAMSGVTGNDIYTRALGVAFNTGTCESFVNLPMAYPGHQISTLESLCPGAGRFAAINDVVVADIDGNDGGRDEILVASENGYLYALNAENGSLLWAYNFYYPVRSVIVANVDTDPQLEVLVSVTNGFLYALDQQSFTKPLSAWDGPSPVVNDDADVQISKTRYQGHWRATSDPFFGQPQGYRVALRDEGGALVTDGYLDVEHTPGATVMGVELEYNSTNPQRRLVSSLIPGRRYFLEVISYKGANSSAPTFTDGVLIAQYGDLESSTKSVTPTTTTPGGTLTWQVVVRNSAQVTTAAQVVDPIPMNTTYLPGSASATFGTVSFNASQNRIEWNTGSPMSPGQVVTITFQTQVNTGFSGGLIQNTAQIVNLDSGLITLRSAAAAVGAANLSSAVKTVDKAQALVNDVLTYTIRMTNTGTLTASGLLINDPLPVGVSFVPGSLSATGGSGSALYDNILKRVIWNGNLAPGQALQVQFRVKVGVVNGVLDNCAMINDVQNGAFQRCARTVVGAGAPSLVNSSKTSDRTVYSTTDTIGYVVTLVNNGTRTASVVMHDAVPPGVTVQSASVIPINAGSLSYNTVSGVVNWSGSLAPGETVQVLISGTLNRSDGVMVNRAIVTDATSGQIYTLTREVLVGTSPAINIQKFAEPATVDVGDVITYVLRLENTGNSIATSAVLTDPLPSSTAFVPGSAQATVGTVSYNFAQQRLEWTGPVFLTTPTFITWQVQVVAGASVGFPIINQARSFDGQSDVDEAVALTPVNVPAGKALLRAYVYQGTTGATPMSGVQVSAAGLVTVTSNTDNNGYVGLLVDALVTPTSYAVFQVVPAGFVNLTPNPVGVIGVTAGGVHDVVMRNAPQAPSGFGWVRGVVFNDVNQDGMRNLFSEVGIPGVTVRASDGQSTQTVGDGSFFFLLPAGTRTITQTNLVGWLSSTPDVVTVNVTSGGIHEVNFGDWLCTQGAPLCDTPQPGQARVYGYVYLDADAVLNLPDGLKGADDEGLPLVEVQANVGTVTDTTDATGMYVLDVPAGLVSVQLPNSPAGTLGLSPVSVGVNAPTGSVVRVDFAVVSTTVCGSGYGIVSGFVFSDTNNDGQLIIGVDQPTLTEAAVTLVGGEVRYTNWMYAFRCVPVGAATVSSTNPAGYTNTTPNSVAAIVNDGQTTQVDFGKAFEGTPIALSRVYVPIVRKE